MPSVTACKGTVLKPSSSSAVLKAIALSTIFRLPGAAHPAFKSILKLVSKAPCHKFELCINIYKIPDSISGFLRKD